MFDDSIYPSAFFGPFFSGHCCHLCADLIVLSDGPAWTLVTKKSAAAAVSWSWLASGHTAKTWKFTMFNGKITFFLWDNHHLNNF